MTAILVAQISIQDRSRYSEYEAGFMEIFSKYKGQLLSVDESPEVLEGQWSCTRTVVIQFPSIEEAKRWYHSTEYEELADIRRSASDGNIVLVKGIEAGSG